MRDTTKKINKRRETNQPCTARGRGSRGKRTLNKKREREREQAGNFLFISCDLLPGAHERKQGKKNKRARAPTRSLAYPARSDRWARAVSGGGGTAPWCARTPLFLEGKKEVKRVGTGDRGGKAARVGVSQVSRSDAGKMARGRGVLVGWRCVGLGLLWVGGLVGSVAPRTAPRVTT